MADNTDNEVLQILRQGGVTLPEVALGRNRFRAEYRELYRQLLHNAAIEAPDVEGYQTMHGVLMERMAFFFVCQKIEDAKELEASVDWKGYAFNTKAMLKSIEGLLKEMRAIKIDRAFKHSFVTKVVDVINRAVSDPRERRAIVRELKALAEQ